MNWLNVEFEKQRRQDELRALEQQAEIEALLAPTRPPKASRKTVRKALGNKLVEWGEKLQDAPRAPRPSTSKI